MIEMKNVKKAFDQLTVLDSVDLKVDRGSICGLFGLNGSGKTTLLKLISGIYKAEAGEITIEDQEVFDNAIIKQRISYLTEEPYFRWQSTLRKMAEFYRGYYTDYSMELFDKLVGLFQLDPNKSLNKFSKGMRKQADFILALSSKPDYLLMDETFDGIDPVMRDVIRQILLEGLAEKELTILISSHNIRELTDLCDSAAILNNKKIILSGNIDDIKMNRCKYRIVMPDGNPEDIMKELLKSGIKYSSVNKEGKFITFFSNENANKIEYILSECNGLYLESMHQTLEEIILMEMEGKQYELKEIFK